MHLRMSGQPSPKQLESFRESNAKINIWEGAVRSGKTYISLWRFITELMEGPEGEYAMITRTFDTFRRNILKMMEEMIGVKDVGWKGGHRTCCIFDKTVHIIGADDERAEAKIRGPTFSGAYVDEITIIPESVFTMLISRCAMHGAKIFGTTNPDGPFHWLKRNFLDGNSDVKSWKFTLDDNPDLHEHDREYLKRQYKGLWYQRFIEGKWVQAEGTVYDFFEEKYHVISNSPSYTCPYLIGVDYGTNNPCAFVLIGHDKDSFPQLWVEDEYYYDSKIHQRQKTDSEYADDFLKFIENKRIEGIYIDPSAVSFKAELRKRGVDLLFDAQNEVLDGIRYMSKLMIDGKFKIRNHCKNFIKEIQSYVWDDKSAKTGIDRPKKENDHILDAARYALFSHFFGKDGQRLQVHEIDRFYNESRGFGAELPRYFQDPQNIF